MQKNCTNCDISFEITESDRTFHEKISPTFAGKKYQIPPPTHCPNCRQQRRVAQANQLNLYERKCDLTGSTIISNLAPDSPYKIFRSEDWYSDTWDPLEYGRDFDFSRPFFEQFQELSLAVPRPQLHRVPELDENAEYTNYAGRNKNCYLIFDSEDNRNCYYNYSINATESCMECFRVRGGELLYECIDCTRCYNSAFLQDCDNCNDSVFLKNCIGCKHCLMCSNLRNKEYHVENKPVSKEEFERFRSMLTSRSRLQSAMQRFEKLKIEYPQKYMHGVQNEDVVGDYLTNCKHASYCFDSPNLWDCKYVFQAFGSLKNCMDIQECGEAEKFYESAFCGYESFNGMCCLHVLGGARDMFYCISSPHSQNLFGCVGCRYKKYCVFNKQYLRNEYEDLVARIIGHMQKTGEWGEFYPVGLSMYPYNLTLAQDYFPMTKEEVLKRGWQWREEEESAEKYMGPEVELPDDVSSIEDGICEKILRCDTCGKLYKIIPQELRLYRKMNLPLPRSCFHCRHKRRFAMRNPRPLYDRKCDACGIGFKTTYNPDRPERIFCEKCYQESLN
jgi:hypothetical protein